MSFGADLRAWLIAQPAVRAIAARRVHQNRAPESYAGPYVWFARRSIDQQDTTLDQEPGEIAYRQRFDLEAIADTTGDAMQLAAALQQLHTYRGAFGAGTVQGVFIEDQADDYTPRGLMADEALDFGALDLLVIGYTPAA